MELRLGGSMYDIRNTAILIQETGAERLSTYVQLNSFFRFAIPIIFSLPDYQFLLFCLHSLL